MLGVRQAAHVEGDAAAELVVERHEQLDALDGVAPEAGGLHAHVDDVIKPILVDILLRCLEGARKWWTDR